MRAGDPPVQYLVGTPKGRLSKLEKELLDKPWQQARAGVDVKLLTREGELYVLARSADRVAKERAMRKQQLKRLWNRLRQLQGMTLSSQDPRRIEAHIFISFLAYCLHVTLGRWLCVLAPGLTSRSALEKFAGIQMVDVHIPTTDGRTLILQRHTHPEPDVKLLLERLKLKLPAQPPPRITVAPVQTGRPM
jgi:hypothetical protein